MTRPYDVKVESDRLAARHVALVLVLGVAVIFSSGVVVGLRAPMLREIETSPTGAPAQVGLANVTLFPGNEGIDRRAVQAEELQRYSWVDRDAGVVSIPIDRAMQLVVDGAK